MSPPAHAQLGNDVRRKPERETRIPGLARERAPEARGLPEGTRRKPDTDGRANQKVRYGGAPLRAPRRNLFCNLVCRIARLNERWW